MKMFLLCHAHGRPEIPSPERIAFFGAVPLRTLEDARDERWRRGRGWGFAFRTYKEAKVPQPLLASLSLRNSWLLPGVLEI
jgi:hypothetical protein